VRSSSSFVPPSPLSVIRIETKSTTAIAAVYPATIQANGLKTYGMVRQTDQGVYVDPARLPESGAVARVGNAALSRAGLNQARRYEAREVQVSARANRLSMAMPDGVRVRARTDGYIGRPADLPPREQLVNAWRFARG
jgi:hypothetical protein